MKSFVASLTHPPPGTTLFPYTTLFRSGEGSPRYQLVEENGNHEDNPDIDKNRPAKYVSLPGESGLPPMGIGDESLEHMTDRKSTRLNSSHTVISYAVFCLKKKMAD